MAALYDVRVYVCVCTRIHMYVHIRPSLTIIMMYACNNTFTSCQ